MTFTFSDAWILQSLYHSGDGAMPEQLTAMIAYADYVNHAIITYEEFAAAFGKLAVAGVIYQKDESIKMADALVRWYQNTLKEKKRIYALKETEAFQKYLNALDTATASTLTIPSKDVFDRAVKQYLDR